MFKRLLCSAVGAAALFAVTGHANAYVSIRITDTTTAATTFCIGNIATGVGGNCVGWTRNSANNVSFAGTVGNFSVATSSGTGNSPGNPIFANLSATTTSVTYLGGNNAVFGEVGTLEIDLVGFDYTHPDGMLKTFSASASGSSQIFNSPTDIYQAFFYVDPNNGTANTNLLTCSQSITTTAVACPGGMLQWADNGGEFSMRAIQNFTVREGGIIEVTASALVRNVPEPTTLSLLGASMIGLGLAMRRRAAK